MFRHAEGLPGVDRDRLGAGERPSPPDGRAGNGNTSGAKAWTLPGAWASWPIGITETQPFPAIAICEGGPDFLAAHYLALWEQSTHHTKRDVQCAPVAMLGASQRIHAGRPAHVHRQACPHLRPR